MKFSNRETWLTEAVKRLRPRFKNAGNPLPDNVRVSCGFTSKKNFEGECYSPESSSDGAREIFLRPTTARYEKPLDLLGLLVHELCHAALPFGTGHGKAFAALGRAMLLDGKATQMANGAEFDADPGYVALVAALGTFPGARMREGFRNKDRPNRARKLKVCCTECDVTFRISACHLVENARCIDPECAGILAPTSKGGA